MMLSAYIYIKKPRPVHPTQERGRYAPSMVGGHTRIMPTTLWWLTGLCIITN